ncbi:hypothetical protein EWM64_g2839 [Hericium alpestre]|uniref:GH18 domain-containing protein n=1 Tax=Hericium alpestre TaxID=135208 RepID=A0A4Z0A4C0_9AGAM|nr:hypothetical protein EWM64_g2839 [Hericium alpestre]
MTDDLNSLKPLSRENIDPLSTTPPPVHLSHQHQLVPHIEHSMKITNPEQLKEHQYAVAAYPAFDKSLQPAGDSWDATAGGVDQCGNPNVVGGVFDFWGLVQGGFLTANGTAASGIDYRYDNCSQTPYVYNPTSQVMVSYDDATSFAAKGSFIESKGLAGFAMWEAGGDSNDILLDAISGALGIDSGSC